MVLSEEQKRMLTEAVEHRMNDKDADTFPGLLYRVMADVRVAEHGGGNEGIRFERDDGAVFWLVHVQDCCENVYIKDVCGNLFDLVGEPILMAVESRRTAESDECSESGTWTFYKFATTKGYVDITFLGESSGYYSEIVSFFQE